ASAQHHRPPASFVPALFLPSPLAQTVWARLARRRQLVRLRREVLVTPDDDDLVLDHLEGGRPARADRASRPIATPPGETPGGSGRDGHTPVVIAVERGAASIKPMPSMDESRKLFEVTFDAEGETLPGGKDAIRSAIDIATV